MSFPGYLCHIDARQLIVRVARIKIGVHILQPSSSRQFHAARSRSLSRNGELRFSQRTAFIFSQPVRSRIIFHPLGFVFHIQAVPGLAITEILAEVQTFTHTISSVMLDRYVNLGRCPVHR
jgi:hypothetical protein